MCMLCVVDPGIIPSREKLENSALNNPHGYGFAIIVPEENRIIRERTMNADESINRFLKLREQYTTGYAMWHARYATHGVQNVLNCHPFIVGKDERTYLAHNGVLDINIPDKDTRSDTRIFAEELLPAIGGVKSLDNDHVWSMLHDYAGGSKICILTVDPEAEHQCYVINARLGKKDKDGTWWSNDSCYIDYGYANPVKKHYSSWLSTNPNVSFKDDEDDLVECHNCLAVMDSESITFERSLCLFCKACLDCAAYEGDCMCYTPKLTNVTNWGKQDW